MKPACLQIQFFKVIFKILGLILRSQPTSGASVLELGSSAVQTLGGITHAWSSARPVGGGGTPLGTWPHLVSPIPDPCFPRGHTPSLPAASLLSRLGDLSHHC